MLTNKQKKKIGREKISKKTRKMLQNKKKFGKKT